nr:hypothetical protein GCM10020093_077850 [Planobispora longispora]
MAPDLHSAGAGGVDETGVEDLAGNDVVGPGDAGQDPDATREITDRRFVGR